MNKVECEIPIPETAAGYKKAVICVSLLETTLADQPAVTISEITRNLREHTDGTITVILEGDLSNPRARYRIRVHLDLDGDGRISPGDYVTVQAYRLHAGLPQQRIRVELREVE